MDSLTIGALQETHLNTRGYLYLRPLDETGTPMEIGFYSGEVNPQLNVVSAQTGSVENREYIGSRSLLSWDSVPFVIGLEARSITVKLDHLNSSVNDLVRAYNPKLAEVELHRGMIDRDTGALVSTPFPIFYGHVDSIKLRTAKVKDRGEVTMKIVSDTFELTRYNTSTKSHAHQQDRSGDMFRKYSDNSGVIPLAWGELLKGNS